MRTLDLVLRRWPVAALGRGLVCCCVAISSTELVRAADQQVAAGKALFNRDWQPNDAASGRGDGLGPMFNARSCVACHNQAGVGGGGAARHNADMVTAVAVNGTRDSIFNGAGGGARVGQLDRALLPDAQGRLSQLAPAFRFSNSIVVHRFGSAPEYEAKRGKLLGYGKCLVPGSVAFSREFVVEVEGKAALAANRVTSITFQRSQRNTPSLFGDGAIDQIDQAAIARLRGQQPPQMGGTIAGRFGWHGQTANLREFVLGACANELGLQTPGHFQARDPLQPGYFSRDPDMDESQVAELVSFVASLPPPLAETPKDREQRDAIRHGAKIFTSARCSACHVPVVGGVKGIYSDLMTHDMGEGLSDPAGIPTVQLETSGPPPEDQPTTPSASASAGTQYYGQWLARQWRTPPLWGVRYTAPYMHDGRAATIEEAILLHGGQAGPSVKFYSRLTPRIQQHLVAYVLSLGAPYSASPGVVAQPHEDVAVTESEQAEAAEENLLFPTIGLANSPAPTR